MPNPTCQWGDCDNPATHRVVYTTPVEQVSYCEACLSTVRQHLDYEAIKVL